MMVVSAVLLVGAFVNTDFAFIILSPFIDEEKYLYDLVGDANQSACQIFVTFV